MLGQQEIQLQSGQRQPADKSGHHPGGQQQRQDQKQQVVGRNERRQRHQHAGHGKQQTQPRHLLAGAVIERRAEPGPGFQHSFHDATETGRAWFMGLKNASRLPISML